MRGRKISFIAVGAGLLSMLLAGGARADDKKITGPIDSIEDLQDVGKLLFKLADTNNDNASPKKKPLMPETCWPADSSSGPMPMAMVQ